MTTSFRTRRDLLSIDDLGRDGILEVLQLARSFSEVSERAIPKVPALRGRTVATAFFEASTRTRLSFETAAKRLSADTMTFSAAGSSLSKGESLRDTVETLDAMGVDVLIVRHSAAGAPRRIATWVKACVINAGDGAHEHPTQALLDAYTIREALELRTKQSVEDLDGLQIAIVGDVLNSRVARSNVLAFTALGARVTLVGPSTLLPASIEGWPVALSADLDAVLEDVDVAYMLRLQNERTDEALIPSVREYRDRFGLTTARAERMRADALILHPGPMNRGVEIDAAVTERENALVTTQVKNGVAVRMAVLFSVLQAQEAVEETLEEFEPLEKSGVAKGLVSG